ncbi:MAG TPA: hemolysin family protein [Pyrinomonadaceae bacterium]|nr:hemolysin family protein [Pyrinomonadaceae bacterium]
MITVFYFAIVFLLVLANGFFVASEFALVGVRRSRIETLAAQGNRRARRLVRLLENLTAYISATQLGITMASLALGWIGEPVFAHLLEKPLNGIVSEITLHTISFAIAFTVITFLHIVLGELAPKTFALERTERVALAISLPMETFYRVFYWPIRFLDWAGTRTVRLFGLHPATEHASVYTPAELRLLVDISQRSGHLQPEQRQLLDRAFEFTDLSVRDAMIPRTQIVAVPVNATLEQVRSAFLTTGYSRLPVYRGRSDDIVGVVYRKDLDMGQVSAESFKLESVMRAAVFVHESVSAGEALKRIQRLRTHFLFIVNEHGGIEGILTLEDLLEEIVGEINDEYDQEVRDQIVADKSSFLLDGMLGIRNANEHLGLSLPEDEGYATIAGFLMARTGRVLTEGDTVEIDQGVFRIERVEKRHLKQVRFTPKRVGLKLALAPIIFASFAASI